MPKRNQQHPARGVTGNNNPKKTTEQRRTHSELEVTHQANSRLLSTEPAPRNGSDSNANNHRKEKDAHSHQKHENQPPDAEKHLKDLEPPFDEIKQELEAHNLEGENHGLRDPETIEYGRSLEDIKPLQAKFPDLTSNQLSSISPVATGTRLKQGATYIDLNKLDEGEFLAMADMVATPDHLYIAKKETDYELWDYFRSYQQEA